MYSSWNIPPQYKGACSSSQVIVLLDLYLLTVSLTKGNNFPESIRPISKWVQSFRGLQLLLPVGAPLPLVPGHGVLHPEAGLAHDGRRPHEVLRERNNIEECWRHRRKERFSREIFQYKYSEQVNISISLTCFANQTFSGSMCISMGLLCVRFSMFLSHYLSIFSLTSSSTTDFFCTGCWCGDTTPFRRRSICSSWTRCVTHSRG